MWIREQYVVRPPRTLMKKPMLSIVLLSLFTTVLFADFSEPFTDSPVGKTVTGRGWLIADSDGKSKLEVVVITDTGHRVISASIPTSLNIQPLLGKAATITATIQPDRSLMITNIELPSQAKDKTR